MNKAKIILLGIAVVGIVGGELAFKAKKFWGSNFCIDLLDTNCPSSALCTTSLPGGGAVQLHCTAVASTTCTATITVCLRD